MRCLLPLLGAALLLLAPADRVRADDLTLYLNVGVGLPADPPEFSELWNAGVSAGGGVGVRLSPVWEVVGSFHYQRFPADEPAQIDDLLLVGFGQTSTVSAIDGRDASALTLMTEARFHVPTEGGRVDPFLAFGWGFVEVSTSDAVVTPTAAGLGPAVVPGDTDGAFGVTVGGGFGYAVTPGVDLSLDLIYTIGFTDKISTQFLPVRLGVAIAL